MYKEIAEKFGKVEYFTFNGFNNQRISEWSIKFTEQELNLFIQEIIKNEMLDKENKVEYNEPQDKNEDIIENENKRKRK